jgi:hypothetical protein
MTKRCLYVQSSLLERSCFRPAGRFAAHAHRLHRASRTTREPQATSDSAAAHRRQLKRRSSGWRARTTRNGEALHSASSDLSDVGADRPFAGMAFSKMRRPGDPTHAQHAGVENVSRLFHAHREPQQSTRFAPPRNNSFSSSKGRTFLMRLPSEPGGACAQPAVTPLRLTRMGGCRTRPGLK